MLNQTQQEAEKLKLEQIRIEEEVCSDICCTYSTI